MLLMSSFLISGYRYELMCIKGSLQPSDFLTLLSFACFPLDFLNVDDEVEYDDETNDDVPNIEEAQSLENSGWSSRTRSTFYLLTLFFTRTIDITQFLS